MKGRGRVPIKLYLEELQWFRLAWGLSFADPCARTLLENSAPLTLGLGRGHVAVESDVSSSSPAFNSLLEEPGQVLNSDYRFMLFCFFGFIASLGPFLVVENQGCSRIAVREPLTAGAAPAEHRLQAVGLQSLRPAGSKARRLRGRGTAAHPLWLVGSLVASRGLWRTCSVAVAHGLRCSEACGIFPDLSYLLCRQGSP